MTVRPGMLPADWWGLGIDVGGTKIAAAVVDDTGLPHHPVRLPTPAASGPQAVLDAMSDAARAALRAGGCPLPGAIGVSTGGVVDHRTGTIVSATSLLPGWTGTAVARELSGRLEGTPVSVDNDGNVLAVGERHFGVARGLDDVLFVAVGTGVAGALIRGGRLIRGAHHTAGELGHLPVPAAGGRPCSCGRTGHLEAAAAGPALEARYRESTGPSAPVGLPAVTTRATAGDAQALEVLREGGAILGSTLGGLANLLDPQAVVIGGGVAACGEHYWRPLTEAFRAELLPGNAAVSLLPADAGPLAAVAGAALLPFTPI